MQEDESQAKHSNAKEILPEGGVGERRRINQANYICFKKISKLLHMNHFSGFFVMQV